MHLMYMCILSVYTRAVSWFCDAVSWFCDGFVMVLSASEPAHGA